MANRRYLWTKFLVAGEVALATLANARQGPKRVTYGEAWAQASEKFREVFSSKLTATMYIAGTAMAPGLNAKAMHDPSAIEKLVVRLIPMPSARSVHRGDVVAFKSPLNPSNDNVLVRRIAATEGEEMVSAEGDDKPFDIPKDHCWVLADNPKLKPHEVIDSRDFGYIPLTNIVGRVIYSAVNANDHGPVTNNPLSMYEDKPVIDAEVDVQELFPEDDDEEDDNKGK